ncbi:MAG TPA: prenyltransferase/squalene oxidase repeat-containing protein [Streptosporangiaceae bacterium]|nr:prenyltransferase/squalene oxidase repeat-containing protein [Streptosporangiaceae bacterium]
MPLCRQTPVASRLPFRLAALTLILTVGSATLAASAAAAKRGPDLVKATAYLVSPKNLIEGEYYTSLPHVADFGLTIDGALALAASGKDILALKNIAGFLRSGKPDQSGKTVNYWSGIGTKFASGGSLAKEALLAEVIGDNPRRFGGKDLIGGLDATVCRSASPGSAGPCAAQGNYRYATSVFDQALGIIAQLRAGQKLAARPAIAYLESLRNADGSFPSLIPPGHDSDIDSTAMAVMALALVHSPRASAGVTSGLAWIASRQQPGGGFHGVAGISVNSAGLAIQALSLRASQYRRQIRLAMAFLASEQNPNGGFSAYAHGQPGSDLRATTQAVSGASGISFGTLSRPLGPGSDHRTTAPGSYWSALPWLVGSLALALAFILLVVLYMLRPWSNRPARADAAGSVQDRISS